MSRPGESKTIPQYGHPALGFKDGAVKPYRWVRDNFYGAGLDTFTNFPAQDTELFEVFRDVLPAETGTLISRWGYTQFYTPGAGGNPSHRMFSYYNNTTNVRYIVVIGDATVWILDETGALVSTPSLWSGPANIYGASSRDYFYTADGTSTNLARFHSSNASPASGIWGIATPATALVPSLGGAGNVTLTVGRQYFSVFKNNTTLHLSDLSPVSVTSGPCTSQQISLASIPVSADSQVGSRVILATADGGDQTFLYLVTTIADNSTTTATDNLAEATLLNQTIYLSTDALGNEAGVADNTPPPSNLKYPLKHRGRMWGASGSQVYFSKSSAELTTASNFVAGKFEEAWPADFFFDISEQAENVRGFMSYGGDLHIATEHTIYKVQGDGPDNFQKPEVVFDNVGVINQDVWVPVFVEGSPIGTMFLSADLRVIATDFNTFKDVGTPIQSKLNNITLASAQNARAGYFSSGAYAFYVLAFPANSSSVNSNFFLYNLRTQKWFEWTPAIYPGSFLQNIASSGAVQMLFTGTADRNVYIYDPTTSTDNGTVFAPFIRTSWQDFGDPSMLKMLNEIEVWGSPTAFPTGLTMQVQGSNGSGTATTVVTNATPSTPPITIDNTCRKLYLAGKVTGYKWYKLQFSWTAGTQGFGGYSVHVAPVSRF